ncbi:hypothetical protein FA95DRAFT_500600 [Auriscalpium vulgare]|uniref:Uncharacterized protein n=1 Tax=Auriscalpium vulgare TaxID=40419 RepID=A0ACB8S429_9AGAM|nr:hypothetical protein FA95DRAFT_500600 [Auriscalpium vulgare]
MPAPPPSRPPAAVRAPAFPAAPCPSFSPNVRSPLHLPPSPALADSPSEPARSAQHGHARPTPRRRLQATACPMFSSCRPVASPALSPNRLPSIYRFTQFSHHPPDHADRPSYSNCVDAGLCALSNSHCFVLRYAGGSCPRTPSARFGAAHGESTLP